jgi:hypothetical protein
MTIKTYKFKDDNVNVKVPFDGETYLNATEVYKAFGKTPTSFNNWKQRTLVPYAEKLIELNKIPYPQIVEMADTKNVTLENVIVVRQGGNKLHETGTWLHPKLAIVFARWLSMDFEIWCDEKISELLSTGYTDLLPQDQKYLELYERSLDANDPSDKRFTRAVREMLLIHESEGYSIKRFEEFLASISKTSDKEARLENYRRINKVVEALYQAGKMDITTREKMKKLCQTRITMVLTGRVTRAENKLKQLTLKTVSDKEVHDAMVEMSEDIKKAEEKVAVVQAASVGVAVSSDAPIQKFEFNTDIVNFTNIKELTDNITLNGYKTVFQGFLEPRDQKAGARPMPVAALDKIIPGKGRVNAAVWKHSKHHFVRYSEIGQNGNFVPNVELNAWESKELPCNYSGTNKLNTAAAVYNENTRFLVIYGIPS